jgi:hypothetical protein
MSGQMRYANYMCSKCAAIDTDKLFPEEPVKPVINCWKCHAGFQVPIDQMLQARVGMFPTEVIEAA